MVKYIPLVYLYRTRLGSYRALFGYFCREFIPVAVTLKLVFGFAYVCSLAALAGGLVLYECGYLLNDLADSAREKGGDRLPENDIPLVLFICMRLLVYCVLVAFLYRGNGSAYLLKYFLATLGTLALLCVHTFSSQWTIPFVRVCTFAALSVGKYACMVAPVLAWSQATEIFIAVFFSYSFPRILVYTIRKYGDPTLHDMAESSFPAIQFSFLVLFAALLADPFRPATALVWLLHLFACVLLAGLSWTRNLVIRHSRAKAFIDPRHI